MRNDPGFTLYDEAGHPVDINSQDFGDVITWLMTVKNLPAPLIQRGVAGTPDGKTFENITLVWQKPGSSPYTALAYLVMNSPEVNAICIEQYLGVAVDPTPVEYAPPVVPVVIPPPVAPKVLVGPLVYNTMYQPVAHDDSPDGTIYTDYRGKFKKHVVPSMIGNSVYWEKIG